MDRTNSFWKYLLLCTWRLRSYLLFVLDLIAFFFSIILAYYLRFHVDSIVELIPPQPSIPPIAPFLKAATLLTISWLFLLIRSGAYRGISLPVFSRGLQIKGLINSGFYAFALMMVIGALYREMLVSRVAYLLAFIIAMITATFVRLTFKWIENYLDTRKILQERLVVIGKGARTLEFLQNLKSSNASIVIVGKLGTLGDYDQVKSELGLPVLGELREIAEIFRRTPFDCLLFIPDEEVSGLKYPDRELIMLVMSFCESKKIPFYIVPDSSGVAVSNQEVCVWQDYPIIELSDASLHPGYKVVKRLMDIVLSLVILVLGLPLWFLIALLIKLTCKGPVFYIQERVGFEGKPFRMYKFRSMIENADARLKEMINFDSLPEPVFNIKQDPRVTIIGRILRNWSLDEVPQFINVLWGAMSLVGPRPERVELVARYNLWQRRRLKAKPGITGYQQIMSRGDPSLEKRVALDLYYLKHQGLWLDLFIMAKTIVVVISGDGLK